MTLSFFELSSAPDGVCGPEVPSLWKCYMYTFGDAFCRLSEASRVDAPWSGNQGPGHDGIPGRPTGGNNVIHLMQAEGGVTSWQSEARSHSIISARYPQPSRLIETGERGSNYIDHRSEI